MTFFPLILHPEYGFDIPSYNARQALKNIAQSYVNGQVKAKPSILMQKIRPNVQYSVQVLLLGDASSLMTAKDFIKVNIMNEDLRLNDAEVKAWIRMDNDHPDAPNALFMMRSEPALLEKVDLFFQGFIHVARQGEHRDGR